MSESAYEQFIACLKNKDFPGAVAQLAYIEDVETRTATGGTLLIAAASVGAVDVVRALLARGADVNARQHNEGSYTALLFALYDKDDAMADVLLAHGADPNLVTDDGWSPLMFATQAANIDMIEKLVASGADRDYVGAGGQRAFDVLQGCFSIDASLKLIHMNLLLMPAQSAATLHQCDLLEKHVEDLRDHFRVVAQQLRTAENVLARMQKSGGSKGPASGR